MYSVKKKVSKMLDLVKEGVRSQVSFDKGFESVSDFIMRVKNVYSALITTRDNKMTKREEQFFIASVINHNLGFELKSVDSDYVFDKVFGKHRRSDRGDYITKLSDKGWMKMSGGDLILPDIFNNLDLQTDEIEFKVNFKLENNAPDR